MNSDISYINKYLSTYQPSKHDALITKYPHAVNLLTPNGLSLGDAQTALACDAAKEMLSSVDETSARAIKSIMRKLKLGKRLELIGSVLALITSGGVVGAIVGLQETIVAAILGAIGFIGSLVTLFVQWLKGGVSSNVSLDKSFDVLQAHCWQARELLAKLKRGLHDNEIDAFIAQSNELAKQVFLTLGGLGYEPEFSPV